MFGLRIRKRSQAFPSSAVVHLIPFLSSGATEKHLGCISFAAGTAECFSSGHREESTVSLLLMNSRPECSSMFPEAPKKFASLAQRLAEGYRKARANMISKAG
jgi:hypothetical protein